MKVYLGERMPENQHSRNLFTLRYDLHFGQFDRQTFVMVPKYGRFVVHFIQPSEESANIFHNTAFDHENTLSHDLLYARFAWSLIRIAGTLDLSKDFAFSDDDDDESPGVGGPSGVAKDIGGGWEGERKRGEDDDGRETVAVGGDHGDGGSSEITSDVGRGGRAEKRKRGGDSEEEDAHGGDHGDSSAI